jgi:hypothetical protein
VCSGVVVWFGEVDEGMVIGEDVWRVEVVADGCWNVGGGVVHVARFSALF